VEVQRGSPDVRRGRRGRAGGQWEWAGEVSQHRQVSSGVYFQADRVRIFEVQRLDVRAGPGTFVLHRGKSARPWSRRAQVEIVVSGQEALRVEADGVQEAVTAERNQVTAVAETLSLGFQVYRGQQSGLTRSDEVVGLAQDGVLRVEQGGD